MEYFSQWTKSEILTGIVTDASKPLMELKYELEWNGTYRPWIGTGIEVGLSASIWEQESSQLLSGQPAAQRFLLFRNSTCLKKSSH